MVLPLFGGLAAFGFGEGLLVQSQWGASPWTVFAEGIAKHAHISLGWATALISVVVLLAVDPAAPASGIRDDLERRDHRLRLGPDDLRGRRRRTPTG